MSSSGLVVLLVEDNSDDAFLIERQLQRAGMEFELHVVNDGEEAIRYLAGDGDYADRDKFPLPSLVLLDLSLPNKSGFDVLGWIQEQPSFQNIPVVVLTAANDPKSIQKAFSLGASQYLLKPPSAESLRAIIDDLLWTLSRPLRVLIVDDDPETLPLVKRVLEREFHQVDITQVVDEIQWQQVLDKCEFDVVITDFMLHWSNGISVARRVKERFPNCPVLMLTASGDEEVAVAALKAGVDDYIVKNPRHIVRLPAAVRVAMAKIRQQKALSEVERQFQQLFTNSPVGLAIVDAGGHIVHANPALAKMFGYPDPQGMKGLSVFENFVINPEDCAVVFKQFQNGSVFLETQWRRKDGGVFWGQISVSANCDEQGQIVGYQAIIIDTTDRKLAEEALKRSEAELRERQKILEKVLRWGQEVARATDLEECLQRIYEFVRHEVGLDRVGIFFYDQEREMAQRVLGTNRDGSVVLKPNVGFDLKGGTFKVATESPAGFVYTQDYTSEYNLSTDHSMFGVKEHVVVTMKAGEKLVGFLCSDNLVTQRPITEMQIEALRLFANYAGIAIENLRLFDERERRTKLLEKVWEASREISRVTDLKSCILKIRNTVINEFGFDRAAIWLYDPQTDMFRGTYGTGRDGELTDEWDQRIKGDRSIRKALEQPSGFFHTKDYAATFAPVTPIMEGVKEHIIVSLWAGNKPIGVITADMLLTQRQITPEQIEALKLFSSSAGVAIENARLIETLQQRTIELELLARLTHLSSQRLDPESISRAVIMELEKAFPETALFVMLTENDSMIISAANSLGAKSLERMGLPLKSALLRSQILPPAEFEWGKDFFVANDTSEINLPFFQTVAAAGFKSYAIGLMVQREECIGAIAALRDNPSSFSDTEVALLHTITEHLSVAFYNARLFERLQRTVDELKQTRAALIRQERLQALGQMASGVVHDINNALVPILTFAELLDGFEDETLREVIKHVKRAVDDIVTTVQRLRTFYRPRGPAEEFEPINLNGVIRHAISMTRPRWYDMAQREGVTIEVVEELEETLPPIMGNESELRQALINLLFNAVDAVVAKGEKFGTVTVRTRSHEEWIIFEIADTGVGMDEETKRRCFEPFFTTKSESGSGLGLSMVYGIVQRHEGKIEVESELGRGTLFRIWFPLKKEAVSVKERIETKVDRVPSLRVLVIDDDPRVQEALKAMLEHLGHQPIVVENGEEGIAAFKQALEIGIPFELVITDLGMPKVSGAEVSQKVKEISPNTPVLVITGWGAEHRPVHADYALGKPVRLSTLKEAIARILGAKRQND